MNGMMHSFGHTWPVLAALLALLAASCGDDKITPPDTKEYSVQGVLFYNGDNGTSLCHFLLKKDGENLVDAQLAVEGSGIAHAGQGVYRASSPGLNLSPGDTHTVTIESAAGEELFSWDFVLPDTFSTVVASPPNRIYNTGGNVLIAWNGSVHVINRHYIVTVVPKDSGAVIPDYAVPATSPTNDWTIPPAAFQKSDGTLVLDTFNIYVLAYRETFFDPNTPEIFFPLPGGIFAAGNISTETFSGTIGVGTLSKGDYIISDKQR